MQNLVRASNMLPFLFIASLHAKADDGVHKEKTYSKTYTLSSGDAVDIDNKFGKVDVITWDKSEVQVDVLISVTDDTEEEVNYELSHIHINDSKSQSTVSFSTDMDINEDDSPHRNHREYRIDYTVHLPAAQTLDLRNKFGNISLPDYSGAIDITCKFGHLDAGKLSSLKSLKLEFGQNTSHIAAINGGSIDVKYSKVDIDELSGDIVAEFKFSELADLNVSSKIRSLKIRNSYAPLRLKLDKGIPTQFNISTKFGSLNNHSDYTITDGSEDEDNRHPHFRKNYSGKSGDGSVQITIDAEFATIDIR
jgi:hypothetical protein